VCTNRLGILKQVIIIFVISRSNFRYNFKRGKLKHSIFIIYDYQYLSIINNIYLYMFIHYKL